MMLMAAVEMRFTTYGLDFDRTNWFIRATRTEIVVRGMPDDRTTGQTTVDRRAGDVIHSVTAGRHHPTGRRGVRNLDENEERRGETKMGTTTQRARACARVSAVAPVSLSVVADVLADRHHNDDWMQWMQARWPGHVNVLCRRVRKGEARACLNQKRLPKADRCLTCRETVRLMTAYLAIVPDRFRPVSRHRASGPVRVIQMVDGPSRPYQNPRPDHERPYKSVPWNEIISYRRDN